MTDSSAEDFLEGPRPVLVVDFGAQYAQLIARRVREARIYSEVISHDAPLAKIQEKNPVAIILSGGPASVYAEDAPELDPAVFDLDIPVFGICYGFQAMAAKLGGEVANTGGREFGRTTLTANGEGILHQGLSDTQPVWMSHNDAVQQAPEGFTVTGSTPGAPVAAFENLERRMAGVQYHPEVLHTPHGQQILTRFLYEVAGLEATWTAANIADALIDAVADQIGDGRAICGLSGGVDSAVAAALVQRAIGDRLTCVFVDHGLLRAGEREQVQHDFVGATGAKLVTVDAAEVFLKELSGVSDPETKRKIIGREFIRSFEGAVSEVLGEEAESGRRSSSWSRAPCTPTSWNLVAAAAPRTSRATTTSAACPTTSSSASSSPCACCSRTRSAPSVASSACPRRSWHASRSRARVWLSASSAR